MRAVVTAMLIVGACASVAAVAEVGTLKRAPAPMVVPFDFARGELAFEAEIGGRRVTGLLDTGVDPSVIDLELAESLHLPVQKDQGGEGSGMGDGKGAMAYPATIAGLSIRGRAFAPVEALASDMKGLSTGYGSPLHFVLGYSFLQHQPVLVDYARHSLTFLDRGTQAAALTKGCAKHFEQPLVLLEGENWPIISAFRFGTATAPVTLDTGSNSGAALYQSALGLGNVQVSLKQGRAIGYGGFRGDGKTSGYTFDAPMGFGPFDLPAGAEVTVRKDAGSVETRVANLGNRVPAAMKLRMLLDYPGKRIAFWGDCPA